MVGNWRSPLRLIASAAVALALNVFAGANVSAQQTDPPAICSSSATIWNAVSSGRDLAVMRSVRAQTPGACRQLLARIDERIAVLTTPVAAAPTRTPVTPSDACVQARTDWESVQNSNSLAEVRAYRSMVPATCALFRARADEKISSLEEVDRQRLNAANAQQALEQRRDAIARQLVGSYSCSGGEGLYHWFTNDITGITRSNDTAMIERRGDALWLTKYVDAVYSFPDRPTETYTHSQEYSFDFTIDGFFESATARRHTSAGDLTLSLPEANGEITIFTDMFRDMTPNSITLHCRRT